MGIGPSLIRPQIHPIQSSVSAIAYHCVCWHSTAEHENDSTPRNYYQKDQQLNSWKQAVLMTSSSLQILTFMNSYKVRWAALLQVILAGGSAVVLWSL